MNNNEKKIAEEYKALTEASAPDMDALWARIDAALPEKNSETEDSPIILTSTKKALSFRRIASCTAAAAACILLAFALPTLAGLDDDNISYSEEPAQAAEDTAPLKQESTLPVNNDAEASDEEASDGMIAEEPSAEEKTQSAAEIFGSSVDYSSLLLADSTQPVVTSVKEHNSGSVYFVEEDVLAQTEVFCKAIVKDVYFSKDNSTVYYTLKAADSLTKDSFEFKDEAELTVSAEVVNGSYFSDKSEYLLMEDRQYLLPICSDENGEYKLVYPFAPQIEITLDNYYIFHNGWNSLMSDGVCDVLCNPQGADDFYYDRMKLCSAEEVEKLISYWMQGS